MDWKDKRGDAEAEDMDGACLESTRMPPVSGRMKHLLFGVRLSVASASLEPARDLEDLARSLDAARARRCNSH
jgi:hypothetical protein